ncbi:MAG: antibiotic biosynthesis monooxygenase family protein [Acidimicrobiales bacterium]
MAVVETTRFRLAPGADVDAFLRADRRVQAEFIPNHPGFLRRTTARGADGEWLVVVLWQSEEDAARSSLLASDATQVAAFDAYIDQASVVRARYETLD